jgi:hypothetical protein
MKGSRPSLDWCISSHSSKLSGVRHEIRHKIGTLGLEKETTGDCTLVGC